MWRTKAKGNVDKIKLKNNLQPIYKFLRQAEYDIPLGTPNCLNVNALLEAKSKLSFTIAGPLDPVFVNI